MSKLIEIFEKEPLYKKCKLSYDEIIELRTTCQYIIEAYCYCCNKIRSFKASTSGISSYNNLKEEVSSIHLKNIQFKENNYPLSKCYFVEFKFQCTHCEEEHRISLLFTPESVIKYGQYPSYFSEEETEIIKYKNVISKYYIELRSSIKAYSQHMGIAAFVYLRRILEHIVEKEYKRITDSDENIKFIDKFKIVDDDLKLLPEELADKKNAIYTVLSKGVHEYEEDECYKLYPIMKYIIITVLDNYLYEKKRKEKLKEISKVLTEKVEGE